MRMRLVLLALLALFLAAGCGSGGGGGSNPPDAASIVPANTQAFVTIDTDGDSDQVQSALAVLDKFPIRQKLTTQLEQSASKNGIHFQQLLSTVGPVLDVAVLKIASATGAVGFAQPDDEQAFVAQLKDTKHTTVDGWTVFADSQALLDAVTNRQASLADNSTYQAAIGSIPGTGDAVARVYAPGTSLKTTADLAGGTAAGGSIQALTKKSVPDWITGALTSSDSDGVKLEVHVKQAAGGAPTGTANLSDQIPADALAALSITGGSLKALPAGTEEQLDDLTQKLGIDVSALIGALNGPVIVYVKQGTPIPEVTLAAKPPDAAGTSRAIGALMTKLVLKNGGSIKKLSVSGVELNSVSVGPVQIYWGTFNGELVVTDNPASLASLKNGPSSKLTDDADFKAAVEAAGMPDDNEAFLYVDLKDTVPMVEGLATLGGQQIPPSVEQSLAPLKTLLAYGARDGQVQTGVVNLETN